MFFRCRRQKICFQLHLIHIIQCERKIFLLVKYHFYRSRVDVIPVHTSRVIFQCSPCNPVKNNFISFDFCWFCCQYVRNRYGMEVRKKRSLPKGRFKIICCHILSSSLFLILLPSPQTVPPLLRLSCCRRFAQVYQMPLSLNYLRQGLPDFFPTKQD